MTKQQIITKCIEAYTEAIEVCKSLEIDEAKAWLCGKGLQDGVCVFSAYQLNKHLIFYEWVRRNETTHKGYWTTPSYKCMSHGELMESLTTRLEILQRELSIPE